MKHLILIALIVVASACENTFPDSCPGFRDGDPVQLQGSPQVWRFRQLMDKAGVSRTDTGFINVRCDQIRHWGEQNDRS